MVGIDADIIKHSPNHTALRLPAISIEGIYDVVHIRGPWGIIPRVRKPFDINHITRK